MDEPHSAYFITAYSLLILGCFFFTRGLYREISARVVLALFSPVVFIFLGPLIAAFISMLLRLALFPLIQTGLQNEGSAFESHLFGISLISAAAICVYCLKWYSDRELKKKERPTSNDDVTLVTDWPSNPVYPPYRRYSAAA